MDIEKHPVEAIDTSFYRLQCSPRMQSKVLRCRVFLDKAPNLLLISDLVLLKQIESVGLCWGFRVRLIKQRLDAEQDLFDCNCRLPALLLIQDRQADCARGVDVRMEQWRDKFA